MSYKDKANEDFEWTAEDEIQLFFALGKRHSSVLKNSL